MRSHDDVGLTFRPVGGTSAWLNNESPSGRQIYIATIGQC